MNRRPNTKRVGLAAIAGASLLAAFLLGRGLPGGSPAASAAPRPAAAASPGAAPVPRPARNGATWRETWDAPTAAGRTLAVLGMLDNCESRDDFLAAIATIQAEADKPEKQRFLALLFAAWLDTDPLTALAEVRRLEPLRHDPGRVAESFRTWASLNPGSAAGLLRQVLDGRQAAPAAKPPFLDGVDPPEFVLSLVAGLGSADPSLAAATLARAFDSPVRTSAIEVLLQGWHTTDPAAVRRWASSIDEPKTRRLALATAGAKAGQEDSPEPALTWAMKLPTPDDQRAALEALTGQWSQRHAADAFAWTRALPDGDLKFALMPGVLRQLAILDPGAAADWLNQYEAAPAMDAGVAAYAKAIQFTNPPAAIGSAAAITDPQLRDEVIRRLARTWLERDPEPARRFIDTSPLFSGPMRRELLPAE